MTDCTVCTIPPNGWHCTRAPGHVGPCAAIPCATELRQQRERKQVRMRPEYKAMMQERGRQSRLPEHVILIFALVITALVCIMLVRGCS